MIKRKKREPASALNLLLLLAGRRFLASRQNYPRPVPAPHKLFPREIIPLLNFPPPGSKGSRWTRTPLPPSNFGSPCFPFRCENSIWAERRRDQIDRGRGGGRRGRRTLTLELFIFGQECRDASQRRRRLRRRGQFHFTAIDKCQLIETSYVNTTITMIFRNSRPKACVGMDGGWSFRWMERSIKGWAEYEKWLWWWIYFLFSETKIIYFSYIPLSIDATFDHLKRQWHLTGCGMVVIYFSYAFYKI